MYLCPDLLEQKFAGLGWDVKVVRKDRVSGAGRTWIVEADGDPPDGGRMGLGDHELIVQRAGPPRSARMPAKQGRGGGCAGRGRRAGCAAAGRGG